MPRPRTEVVWRPQPGPQTALVTCPVKEVLYGGARGGGKTDGSLGDFAIHADKWGDAAVGLFFRRELPQLDDAIERSQQIYGPLGAEYHKNKKEWRFQNGALLRFRALERDSDAEKYQGHSYTRLYPEELGNFGDPRPYFKMIATLRSARCTELGIRATANPGGPGHHWIKRRFIDPNPRGFEIIKDPETGEERVFIPSRVDDNPALLKANPGYKNQLKMAGSETLVRAWLDGDWSIVEGAYFDTWGDRHIIAPFEIPQHWLVFGSYDWGYASPGSYGLWAVSDGSVLPDGRAYPKGAMIRITEDYQHALTKEGAYTGERLEDDDVAKRILSLERGFKVRYRVADPSIFAQRGGVSTATRMQRAGVNFRPADNERVAGWSEIRNRLRGVEIEEGVYEPMIYAFRNCLHSIRTIPMLQHDETRPEDLDTDGEDHCFAAGTLVDTDIGPVPIEKLEAGKHAVWSAGQWRTEIAPRMTRKEADIVLLRFSNGVEVKCTPDHRFMDCSGEWRYAMDLQGMEVSCDQHLLAAQSRNLTGEGTTFAGTTFKERASAFTEKFGVSISGKSQKAGTSIIRMKMSTTTRPKILNALPHRPIWAALTGLRLRSVASRTFTRPVRQRQNGTAAMLAGNGTVSTTASTSRPSWSEGFLQSAMSAAENTWFRLRELSRANTAAVRVKPVRCVSVEKAGKAPVYCLSEPITSAFTIEGGLIVHNCADEWRYAAMSRPWVRKKKRTDGPLSFKMPTWNEMFKSHQRAKYR